MICQSEQLFSKAATRKELKISRARYEKYVEEGILPKPVVITKGSRPVHSASHIIIATRNLTERATRDYLEIQKSNAARGQQPFKLSSKMSAFFDEVFSK